MANAPSSESENRQLLKFIFKDYSQLFQELAPEGWSKSPYVLFFHPSAEQQFEEHKRLTDNLNRLDPKNEKKDYSAPETFKQDDTGSVDGQTEFLYLLGLVVYDIFSNNHTVVDPGKKEYDFGSMRGSGAFIADFFNEMELSTDYDYIDFYMGTVWINSRADLEPFYCYVFEKLKQKKLDWIYSFPRLYLFSPKKPAEEAKPEEYDPEKSVLKELETKESDEKTRELREKLDEDYRRAFEEAKYKPLPAMVKAYKEVFGTLPEGYPSNDLE